MNTKILGDLGEQLSSEYLEAKGYDIILRNYRYMHKEIDIIAVNEDFIVFAEIKSRRKSFEFSGYEAVDRRKQSNIIFAAQNYIVENKVTLQPRFDVLVAIYDYKTPPNILRIEHIENAF